MMLARLARSWSLSRSPLGHGDDLQEALTGLVAIVNGRTNLGWRRTDERTKPGKRYFLYY
jgi:hypothetical protein